MSNNKQKKRKPKFFDFEHAYKATLPGTADIEFTNGNHLQIRVEGMDAKDIDMELNMFLAVDDVKRIWLILPCQCRIEYDNYGKKLKKEWCQEHISETYQ
jgi:hypothetical protein